MKRHLLLIGLLLAIGCAKNNGTGNPVPTPTTLEQRARDGIATATGFLGSAQKQYHDQCVAAPTGGVCVTINKGISAQNTAVDALKTYCGFRPADPLDAPCKPVANAADALQSALGNLTNIVNDVKGLVQ